MERYQETNVQKEKIFRLVKQRDKSIRFVKRLTTNRSLAYVEIDGEVFKIVVRKSTNEIITFLTMQTDYKTEPKIYYVENKPFKICLYPDCFLESRNPYGSADFYILNRIVNGDCICIDDHGWRKQVKPSAYFLTVFDLAMNEWRKNKNEENNIKKETKTVTSM